MSRALASYRRIERLPFRQLDRQTVIINPRSREVHVLSGAGSSIWALLDRPRSVVQIVAELEREGPFDVDSAAVAADVAAFVADLADKGLVEAA